MKRPASFALCAALSLLSACGGKDDDYPRLLPTERLLAEPVLPGAGMEPNATNAAAEARADALRARAEKLKEPVIDPGTRERLERNRG